MHPDPFFLAVHEAIFAPSARENGSQERLLSSSQNAMPRPPRDVSQNAETAAVGAPKNRLPIPLQIDHVFGTVSFQQPLDDTCRTAVES